MPKTVSEETERLKRHWEREAPTYDRRMGFFERVLIGDGRQWVCSRASGDVLEVAVGTGRNFTFYPLGVRLSGIDLRAVLERASDLIALLRYCQSLSLFVNISAIISRRVLSTDREGGCGEAKGATNGAVAIVEGASRSERTVPQHHMAIRAR